MAVSILDDWGGHSKLAEILSAIHNLGVNVAASGGAKVNEDTYTKSAEFLPQWQQRSEPERTAESVGDKLRKKYGNIDSRL